MGMIIDGFDMSWDDGWDQVDLQEAARSRWAKAQARRYGVDRATRKQLLSWLETVQNFSVDTFLDYKALTSVWVPEPESGRVRATLSLATAVPAEGASPEQIVAAEGDAKDSWQGRTDGGVPYYAISDDDVATGPLVSDLRVYWLFPAGSRSYAKLLFNELRLPEEPVRSEPRFFDRLVRTAELTLTQEEGAQAD